MKVGEGSAESREKERGRRQLRFKEMCGDHGLLLPMMIMVTMMSHKRVVPLDPDRPGESSQKKVVPAIGARHCSQIQSVNQLKHSNRPA